MTHKKAIIDENNLVQSVSFYLEGGAFVAQLPLGYKVYDCTGLNVQSGDTFDPDTNTFWRDGVQVDYLPSDADRIEALEAILESLLGGVE